MTQQTTAPQFVTVPEHVARNPVAQAVARTRLAQSARDFQIRVHLLHDGEHIPADIQAAAQVIATAAAILAARGQSNSSDSRIMAGTLSCLAQCAQRGHTWRTIDRQAIVHGFDIATAVISTAAPHEKRRAYLQVKHLEATA